MLLIDVSTYWDLRWVHTCSVYLKYIKSIYAYIISLIYLISQF